MQPLRLTIPGVHQTKGRHADMLTAFQGQMVVCSRLPASDTLLSSAVLAASGRLEELAASVHLAEHIQTPREVWLWKAALGKVLARLGWDKEAEVQLTQATQTIEAIAANLQTPRLHHSFLSAAPVIEVYAVLGHRPPLAAL